MKKILAYILIAVMMITCCAVAEKEYGKYSIQDLEFNDNFAYGKVVVTDGEAYNRVYARVTVWFGDNNYVVMRAEVIDGEFEAGYGVTGISGITVIITSTKNCASVPMSSCNILTAIEK